MTLSTKLAAPFSPEQSTRLTMARVTTALLLLFLMLLLFTNKVFADNAGQNKSKVEEKLLHILDYVSVEYPNVVENGKVLDKTEYQEQLEFSKQFSVHLAKLPQSKHREYLDGQALQLTRLIEKKQSAAQLVTLCQQLSSYIIENYNVVVTPKVLPTLDGAASLFQTHCSGCHGEQGFGNGINAAGLEPPPANFHEQARQQQRSVFALYNTMSMGVAGTAMRNFSTELSAQQRWKLAFYIANFYPSEAQKKAAAGLQDKLPGNIINVRQLTQYTPAMAQSEFGEQGLAELIYLRSHPQTLQTSVKNPFVIVQENLDASIAAHQQGNTQKAYEFAIAAYLEGFELVEPKLKSIDHALMKKIEKRMLAFREASLEASTTMVALQTARNEISGLLDEAEEKVNDTQLSSKINFVSALIIILREGVEAILVLAAIFAVLQKTGRKEMFVYLHAGWISAILLGVLTWFVAGQVFSISGASRELSEGITAIIAAAMLVYVGFWLHNQSNSKQWQSYIKNKISQSLSGKALTGLAIIAFLAVYREVFETILFINTLWLQADNAAQSQIIGGAGSALVVLLVLAWGIFKFSVRLPLKLFFRINAVFLYLLAIVFAGKGIAALQEAGKLPLDSINFIEIDALGIYPNIESLSLQAFLIVLALLFYLNNQFRRPQKVHGAH